MTAPLQVPGVRHRHVDANGLQLHVAEAGPERGPIVLMLHGFPEFWYSWRHQLQGLADAGLRALAVDLRGYGTSGKPAPTPANYDVATLAGDIDALVRALGQERGEPDLRVTLVGHDWGGAVAWAVAALHPERLSGLVILNAPHPVGYRKSLLRHPSQLVKSWYIAMFQVPGLAERMFTKDPVGMIRKSMLGVAGRRQMIDHAHAEIYAQALMAEGVLPCALAYYRAIPASLRHTAALSRPIATPVRVLWGRKDKALGPFLVEASRAFTTGPFEVKWFDDCGHWLQQEAAAEVTAAIGEFARS